MFHFQIFPESASTIAGQVDTFFWVLTGLSVFFTVAIFALVLFFAFRYRRGAHVNRKLVSNEKRERKIEITWTVLPLILALGMFGWSTSIYFNMIRPPANTLDIQVIGKQWMWQIQHDNGRREINELHVPVGQPVKLRMISQDVIHSFFVPAFRIKQDVLPGRYTTEWFQASKVGEYHLFCAEYCGTDHANMKGTVYVMNPADYESWLQSGNIAAGGAEQTPKVAGAALFNQLGCAGCHKPNVKGVGPAIGGIFGSQVELESGATVTIDEEYLRQSIILPSADVVKGFAPIMPTFEGQVSEAQIIQLTAYIKSLSGAGGGTAAPTAEPTTAAGVQPTATEVAPPNEEENATEEAKEDASAQRGETLYVTSGCTACHQLNADSVGPALGGVFGSKVTLESGETITADKAYVRESILMPNAKVVQGFQPIMPTLAGVLSDAEVTDLVNYLESLSK